MNWKEVTLDGIKVLSLTILLTIISYFLGLKLFIRTKYCFAEPCLDVGFYTINYYYLPLWLTIAIGTVILYKYWKIEI